MARLVIYEEGDGEEAVFEIFDLAAGRVLIGSSEDNDLVLDAPEVNSGHASLELRQEQWVLQDLGGPGGTIVNDKSINGPHYLQHNDLIEISHIKIRFQEADPEADLPVETAKKGLPSEAGPHISGRLWFASIAGATVAAIFIILLLLIIADYLNLFNISDLLPPWL